MDATERVTVESSALSTLSGVQEPKHPEEQGHAVPVRKAAGARSRTRGKVNSSTQESLGSKGMDATENRTEESSALSTLSGVQEPKYSEEGDEVPVRKAAEDSSIMDEENEMTEMEVSDEASSTTIFTSGAAQHCEEAGDAVSVRNAVDASISNMDDETETTANTEAASMTEFASGTTQYSKQREEAGDAIVQKAVAAGGMDEQLENADKIGKVDSSAHSTLETDQETQHKEENNATMGYGSPDCQHDNYANYKEETNPQYCKSGSKFYLADVRCALCQDMFTSTMKSKRGLFFKPSCSKPLYACIGSVAGCRHAICYYCFQQKLLESDK